jgi:hypothetical protein
MCFGGGDTDKEKAGWDTLLCSPRHVTTLIVVTVTADNSPEFEPKPIMTKHPLRISRTRDSRAKRLARDPGRDTVKLRSKN